MARCVTFRILPKVANTKHKLSNKHKCLTEAQQFISALNRYFWQYAVMCRFSSQILIKMNTYIVIQMQVDSKSINGNDHNISMSNVVRKVEAETKELAIGKFVIATQDIKANQKFNIECYDITELNSLS